jgi:phosphate:Na+ symporter
MGNLQPLATLVGGIGLFLVGMTWMTDGLKLAAGPALHRILAAATRTRWHGLGSGMLVTALVQSSSAVTVATIGFVNAGLLGLGGALWVLFGANVGSTMTGWIVALVGLKFKVETLALPLIGLGALLRLGGRDQRLGAIGQAVAGFGLLFLGIATMQAAFAGLSGRFELPQGSGIGPLLAQLGIGVLMTVLMQSSSASMTIALAAAQGGLLAPAGAAAVVIGANIGTTLTAVLAAIGATPNAKRAAVAHVAFNVITAAVALALLPWLLDGLARARAALELPADPAAKLALFHTCFNVLGVVLMWPLAASLTRWLQRRFRVAEEDEAQPQHLDANVLPVPTLALDALAREVQRLGGVARRAARQALAGAAPEAFARELAVVQALDAAVVSFVERMSRDAMSAASSERLADLLRRARHHVVCAEQARAAAPLLGLNGADASTQPARPGPGPDPLPGSARWSAGDAVALALDAFGREGRLLLDALDALGASGATGPVQEAVDASRAQAVAAAGQAVEVAYAGLKSALLAAGARGKWPLVEMDTALGRASAMRESLEQARKGLA